MKTRDKPGYDPKRFKQTVKFIGNISGIALDIGERNSLSDYIENRIDVEIVNTHSDLDYSIKFNGHFTDKFDHVFCFQVIEHLLNPRMFFDNLRKVTSESTHIFLSYPSRPKLFWNDKEHFHEYDKLRFNYLLTLTGFEIIRKKNIYVKRKPNGIRPLLRNFIPQTTIYELRKI